MCESVVTEEARLSPGRSSDEDGPLTGPTVLREAPHCTLSFLSDAYMFMYPSSFQLVYGRSPPFARQPHRLFASPEDTPLTHPIGEHQVAGPTVLAAGKRHTQPPL